MQVKASLMKTVLNQLSPSVPVCCKLTVTQMQQVTVHRRKLFHAGGASTPPTKQDMGVTVVTSKRSDILIPVRKRVEANLVQTVLNQFSPSVPVLCELTGAQMQQVMLVHAGALTSASSQHVRIATTRLDWYHFLVLSVVLMKMLLSLTNVVVLRHTTKMSSCIVSTNLIALVLLSGVLEHVGCLCISVSLSGCVSGSFELTRYKLENVLSKHVP